MVIKQNRTKSAICSNEEGPLNYFRQVFCALQIFKDDIEVKNLEMKM